VEVIGGGIWWWKFRDKLSKDWYSTTGSEQGTQNSAGHTTQKNEFEDHVNRFFVYKTAMCCTASRSDRNTTALQIMRPFHTTAYTDALCIRAATRRPCAALQVLQHEARDLAVRISCHNWSVLDNNIPSKILLNECLSLGLGMQYPHPQELLSGILHLFSHVLNCNILRQSWIIQTLGADFRIQLTYSLGTNLGCTRRNPLFFCVFDPVLRKGLRVLISDKYLGGLYDIDYCVVGRGASKLAMSWKLVTSLLNVLY